MINQKGTTLFEYLIAVVIIVAVGIAIIHPGISAWCLTSY
jgi:Tfp pilus assembly protein PilE